MVNTLTEGLRSRHELAERARSASFEVRASLDTDTCLAGWPACLPP